ncbi:MAG: hypothetical protein ACT4PK_09960 [Gammaproteobacteria bacterium]
MSRALGVVAGAVLLACAGAAVAQSAPSIEATLSANAGKRVTLRLKDGDELTGILAGTSPVTVKLVELSGKEFYEAVVRIDEIGAVIVRTPGK